MATVNDILTHLEKIAPVSMKMEWDNVGLLCGSRDKEVKKLLVALDPFEDVCREACEMGANLIVTHHPLIFQPLQSVTDETATGRAIRCLIQNDISAINAHTNLDCAPGGVNDCLAQALRLGDIQVLSPEGADKDGRPWGLLRMGNVKEQSLNDFLKTVKSCLDCPGIRYADGGRSVQRVAVGGGACAGELAEVAATGCDTFVTSDVKYNQFWDAKELGLNLIDAGHFYTENPVCAHLAQTIKQAFPDIQVEISQIHADCMKFF